MNYPSSYSFNFGSWLIFNWFLNKEYTIVLFSKNSIIDKWHWYRHSPILQSAVIVNLSYFIHCFASIHHFFSHLKICLTSQNFIWGCIKLSIDSISAGFVSSLYVLQDLNFILSEPISNFFLWLNFHLKGI